MKFKEKFKLLMKSVFTQFGSAVSKEGQQIIWNADGDLVEGVEVYTEQENEQGEIDYIPVPDGEYTLEDKIVIVANGIVETIKPIEEEVTEEENLEEDVTEVEEPIEEVPDEEVAPDYEKEIADLRDLVNALRAEIEIVKGNLAKLLEVPAEQDAFSAQKTIETKEEKKFLCKVARK